MEKNNQKANGNPWTTTTAGSTKSYTRPKETEREREGDNRKRTHLVFKSLAA